DRHPIVIATFMFIMSSLLTQYSPPAVKSYITTSSFRFPSWEREGDWRLPRKSENPILQFSIAQTARILIKL
ncbi:MAG: hypothetical protein IJ146_05540, partial [Kiritimatiellae bacterium]|nr:hypothetical protein [Kiritimatiellia bacterium]